MTQRPNTPPPATPNGVTGRPQSSSALAGGHGLEVSQSHDVAPQELVVESLPNHLIVIHTTPQPVQVVERADSLQVKQLAKPGDVNIVSAGSMSSCRWDEAISFISLNVSPTLIEQVSTQFDSSSSGSIELIHTFHARDAKILQLSQWLLDEFYNGGASGDLYVDSLINVLAIHLLRTYSSQSRELRAPERLTQQQIADAIDYMHANLDQNISLDALAQVVNVSPSHLRRLFKRATGLAPHQYLTKTRVNRAKELLLTGTLTIGEVAAQVGFADQSHLHRHFKRIIGVTPKAVLAS